MSKMSRVSEPNKRNSEHLDVACLVIAFLRTDGVERLLKAISLAGISRTYIAIDGARSNSEREIQEMLTISAKELAATLGIELIIWKRDSNLGLAASVITGLNWFFSFEENGIIFEDDLDPHPDFFFFAKEALSIYRKSEDVWLISGNQFYSKENTQNTALWATYPLIWGWATWRQAWFEMESSLLDEGDLNFDGVPRSVKNFLSVGKERSLNGVIESWAVPLAASMHAAKKFCLTPPVNLVGNLGDDSFAIHTKEINQGGAHSIGSLPLLFEFSAKDSVKEPKDTDSFIESNIYMIRFRHIFLPLYRPIIDYFLRKESVHKSSLRSRVESVIIPQ
jgi:hypothetical protein